MMLRLILLVGCLVHFAAADLVNGCGKSRRAQWTLHHRHAPSRNDYDFQFNAIAVRGGAEPSSESVLDFLNGVDMFGTGLFAFSGALTAGRKGMDLLGMIIVATITAVGGGTVRDVLLDTGTVFWMRDPIYAKIISTVTVLTFLVWPTLERKCGWTDSALTICYADAFCLGAFAVVGTQKAVDLDLAPILWVICGLMTAVFGGVTRDIICLQRPRVMYPHRSVYGAPPLLGSAVYAFLISRFGMNARRAACVSIMVTFITRVLSWNSPRRLPHWDVEELDAISK